jgi:hypothetical protein
MAISPILLHFVKVVRLPVLRGRDSAREARLITQSATSSTSKPSAFSR